MEINKIINQTNIKITNTKEGKTSWSINLYGDDNDLIIKELISINKKLKKEFQNAEL